MSRKNIAERQARRQNVRQLTICALLCALEVVFARFFALINLPAARLSIEAIPIVLAGYFYGSFAGMIVGFVGDTVGCLFSPYGWDPILCLSPMAIGLFAGLLRPLSRGVKKPLDIWRVILTLLPGQALSVLWTSQCFRWLGYSNKALGALIAVRSLEAGIELLINCVIITLLICTGIFAKAGLFPYDESKKMPRLRVIAAAFWVLQMVILIVATLTIGMKFMDDAYCLLDRILFGIAYFAPALLGLEVYIVSFFKERGKDHDSQ